MLLWRVLLKSLKFPSCVVRSCCALRYDYLNIIENRHYIKLDNLISHNCILNTNQILLIKMKSRPSSSHPQKQHLQKIFIRGVLKNKLKNIIRRIFRHAKKNDQFVEEVASRIQKDNVEGPEITIAYYLFKQVGK